MGNGTLQPGTPLNFTWDRFNDACFDITVNKAEDIILSFLTDVVFENIVGKAGWRPPKKLDTLQ